MEDYKEKYQIALNRAELCYDNYSSQTKDIIGYIFPELKESEDERVKKRILLSLEKDLMATKNSGCDTQDLEQCIAWLEKQGDQKPVIDFKAKNWYVSKVDGKIHDMTYNPTDKVEPKFKVGDWVVKGNVIAQILDVQEQYYVGLDTEGNDFTSSRFLSDDKIHLWTIQDAKDGDVLVTTFEEDNMILMYQSMCTIDTINVHCCLDNKFVCWNLGTFDVEDVKPATKEQRDLLFQTMKEKRYEWDDEKKELKKIEQKYTVKPIFSIGDVLCDKSCTTIDKNSQPNIEVRDIRNDMYICNNCSFPISQQDEYELVEKRIEPQLAWSDEDEGMKENIEGALDCYESMVSEDWEKEKEWLTSIKDRMQPQPKEWSDKDENMLVKIIEEGYLIPSERQWLKSLKNRVSWKPSKKQMETLEYYMHTLLATEHKEVLFGLYNDLKKL